MALRIVKSFREQATSATRPVLPAARKRCQNALITGLQRIAEIDAM
jgi:hypothetical protein